MDRGSEHVTAMNEREHGNTRERIQQVALELFAEQGYEKTSLREIAERLGVTKAALYYHFKTKDDIVASTVEDFLAEIDGLLAWAEDRTRTVETRRELLRRYSYVVARRMGSMRFFLQNPAMRDTGFGATFRDRMRALQELLRDPDAPLTEQIRAMAAIVTLHMSMGILTEEAHGPEEVREAALEVAMDLVTPGRPG